MSCRVPSAGETCVILGVSAPYLACRYFATEGGANAPKDVTSYKTSGNQWVLIHGLNLGSNRNDIDSVEYQMPGTDTPFRVDPGRCTIPEPHRLLRCPTVQGAGQNLEWRIIIARQVSRNPVTGYHRPTVTTVTDVTGANVNSLRTDGGEWITITGTGFGPVAGTQDGAPFVERVRYGRTGTEYEATDVTVLGHDTVSVKTVPGVGQNLKVIVTVATQDSLVSTATLSYVTPHTCGRVIGRPWLPCCGSACLGGMLTMRTYPPSSLMQVRTAYHHGCDSGDGPDVEQACDADQGYHHRRQLRAAGPVRGR